MKYYASARVTHMCIPCMHNDSDGIIKEGEPYVGDSTRAFCVEHGQAVMKGELLFDPRSKKYMTLEAKRAMEAADIEELIDEEDDDDDDDDLMAAYANEIYCQCKEPEPDNIEQNIVACIKCDRALTQEKTRELRGEKK